MKNKWWWPFGVIVWCDESINYNGSEHTHNCDTEEGHGYQHRCHCGFRWAK